MKPMKSGIFIAIAASLLALGACEMGKDGAKKPDDASKGPTAATVNGKAISQSTVDNIVRQAASQGRPDTPETRKAIIDQLALQMVVADEAAKKGLDKSPDVVDQLDSMKQSVLANAYVRDYLKNNPVTDEMLKAEYDRIKASVSGNQYKARHILVEKEAEAKDIIARLKKDPSAFAKLATERSKDPGSKPAGGDLGWFDPSQMVPEFGDAVKKLEKGKFTEVPVKTQFGYHVILLEDTKPVEAPSLDDVKPHHTQQVQQQNLRKQLDSLKASAKIEMAAASAPASAAPAAAPAPGAAPAPSAAPATSAAPAPAPAAPAPAKK
jgi:peptidyl-prolyl cis-trans isomerase C